MVGIKCTISKEYCKSDIFDSRTWSILRAQKFIHYIESEFSLPSQRRNFFHIRIRITWLVTYVHMRSDWQQEQLKYGWWVTELVRSKFFISLCVVLFLPCARFDSFPAFVTVSISGVAWKIGRTPQKNSLCASSSSSTSTSLSLPLVEEPRWMAQRVGLGAAAVAGLFAGRPPDRRLRCKEHYNSTANPHSYFTL